MRKKAIKSASKPARNKRRKQPSEHGSKYVITYISVSESMLTKL